MFGIRPLTYVMLNWLKREEKRKIALSATIHSRAGSGRANETTTLNHNFFTHQEIT